ncbi:hypothetical protein HMPREF9162_0156 [Selenomonas sp. oral taxon 137 str. F0430]|nr:hypothetical protein HMPREF9162_0156 [Selenomonas sp. oral taxon 137 str. F0430]EJP32961.1 hypothetical protein HMPREF1147_1526 [Selenomonas sp. FOBRC9]
MLHRPVLLAAALLIHLWHRAGTLVIHPKHEVKTSVESRCKRFE